MRFGIASFVTDESMRPELLAQAVEERGFDSLFFPEHSHIPANRASPYPGGGDLPRDYYRSYDPFIALAVAAQATRTLLLGTGICALVQRDPIHTAKQVATLDRLSGGRFLFGVGAGWNREEMAQHGTDPVTRMALLRERVLAMKRLWGSEIADFHGDHVRIEPSYQWPKPLQRPHPPVLVGGMGPTVLDRVLEYGDGWLPNTIGQDDAPLATAIAELTRRAADSGRGRISVTVLGAPADRSRLDSYAEMGVERCVFVTRARPDPEVLHRLDELASVVDGLGGGQHGDPHGDGQQRKDDG
ncbi:LLM class F420-dependent oxidoreductase [Streptomyces sp. 110]|uniref:LLM class F420-dependent oxidoreductase n=2 Tax=Streptomyces endocoffeicus TaxID=2898945 RepID=A0ABS1PEN3_9ACTN|nr:LLM class F420-dependent oxidoreductase [Streptomyces endocoffeicus]